MGRGSDRKRAFLEMMTAGSGRGPASDLQDGDRVAVIGGGPAGAFFAYFLLRIARSVGVRVEVEIFEPRHFDQLGPGGCNHCGGIISESLVQLLAIDGINVPPAVVQRGIDTYMLHTDQGSVRILAPSEEGRIAAVHRGGGPRGVTEVNWGSFDGFLLELASQQGATLRRQLIADVNWREERPSLKLADGSELRYDLVAVGTGVNSRLLERFEALGMGFERPRTTTAYVTEFNLGREEIDRRFGSAMHVFLLDLPRLEFGALIPKENCVTMCMLGEAIDQTLVESFLNAPEVKRMFPGEVVPGNCCQCFPHINIDGAPQPFADRMLFIGDSGVTRLYKDGIGAAYRTGKAAAIAALLGGVSAQDLRRSYWPACRTIRNDNAIGKVVFFVSSLIQRTRISRRAMLRMVAAEQASANPERAMSSVLWDIFTGSAPYREVLLRTLKPAFIVRLGWNLVVSTVQIGMKALSFGGRDVAQSR